jgi:hypothetical protein
MLSLIVRDGHSGGFGPSLTRLALRWRPYGLITGQNMATQHTVASNGGAPTGKEIAS